MRELKLRIDQQYRDDFVALAKRYRSVHTGITLAYTVKPVRNTFYVDMHNIMAKGLDERYAAFCATIDWALTDKCPFGCEWDEVLFFDIETNSATDMWDMAPRDFFRLGQYAWGRGDVVLTEDYDEMMDQLAKAKLIVVHNGHNFDLSVLYGKSSITPLLLSMNRKVIDTMVLANLAFPAPSIYRNRDGNQVFTDKSPEQIKRWLSLDNLAYQLKVGGKVVDLKELAKQYNPPKTKVADLDFGLIPVDDPVFREYSETDVTVLRDIFFALIRKGAMTDYYWREQVKAAINAQQSRNGFCVDLDRVEARLSELKERRERLMDELNTKYGMPLEGAQPWRTTAGKEAIVRVLAQFGVKPEDTADWPKTPRGSYKLSGDVIKDRLKGRGDEAEEFGAAIAELMGQRSLAQLTKECTHSDSRVHPTVDDFQRSGRSSTTKPGLTVWTARGAGSVEKSYFVADPGCKLVSFDYSNADARIVAGYAQDAAYMKNFLPGADSHELTGRAVWGDAEYDSQMLDGWETSDEIRRKNPLRHRAKSLTHAWNYGGGAKTISRSSGESIEVATHFVNAMAKAYPKVVKWRDDCAVRGESGSITNDWGRQMMVQPDRAYTQSSALMGQSGTREIMTDALIRLFTADIRFATWLKAQIHDELLFSIPETELRWAVPFVADHMSTTWKGVEFMAAHGEPSDDWEQAGH